MPTSVGPNIVESGLILSLDAGDKNSYSGSGTTWNDLSGNGNNAILNGNINNPVWNSQGYFNFPATSIGLNGGMIINNSPSLQAIGTSATVELIFTLEQKTAVSGDSQWMAIFSRSSTRSNQTPAVSINQTNDGTLRYLHIERPSAFNSSANLFTDYTGNRWYHVTAVLSSTSLGYLNATQVSSAAGGITSNSFPIYLGLDSGLEMFKGKLAIVRMYNRVLLPFEIQQNYKVTKTRFNL